MSHTPYAALIEGSASSARTRHFRSEADAGAEVCQEAGEPCLPSRGGWGETREQTLLQRQAQFERMVALTRQHLYRYARHSVGNAQDAEDVTQETLTRAWMHYDSYDPQRSFEGWLFRIAQNLIIDRNRSKKRRKEISLDAPETFIEGEGGVYCSELIDSASDPARVLLDQEVYGEWQSVLHTLPALHQETLVLLCQDRSYEQIALTLACPLGTVRSRVHRARVMLQRKLKEQRTEAVCPLT